MSQRNVSPEKEDNVSATHVPEPGNLVPNAAHGNPDPSAPITLEMLTQLLDQKLEPIMTQLLDQKTLLSDQNSQLSGQMTQLETMNRKLDHLVAASPHVAMSIENRNTILAGMMGEYREEMTH